MHKNEIKRLVHDIQLNAELYYTGSTQISDTEFDAMVDQLKKLDPDNPILKELR